MSDYGPVRVGLGLLLLGALLSVAIVTPVARAQENVLVVVLDDVGVDKIACYNEYSPYTPDGDIVPHTATIDGLAAKGILFRNAWSSPVCSPARACMQTGRYGFRTGIGNVVDTASTGRLDTLNPDEHILPEILDLFSSGYAHAAIGKWHLTNANVGFWGTNPADAPNLAGYGHFVGTLKNADEYDDWEKVENGVTSSCTTYITTDQVDSAYAWIAQQSRWFCILNLNAAHAESDWDYDDWTPTGLHSFGEDLSTSKYRRYLACLEAADTELGRLLGQLDTLYTAQGGWAATTTIIVVGDNGTPHDVLDANIPAGHGKGTLYEGGVNVPLIAAGAAVDPSLADAEEDALVHVVDIHATVLELAGLDPATVATYYGGLDASWTYDSVSLVPYFAPSTTTVTGMAVPASYRTGANDWLRKTVFSEWFRVNGRPSGESIRAIRNYRFKYLRFTSATGAETEEFYDLRRDPTESTNLDDAAWTRFQEVNYDFLTGELEELLASEP